MEYSNPVIYKSTKSLQLLGDFLINSSLQEQQNLTLLFSSFEGKMTTLYRYLKEGVNFDFPDYDGRTALHLAVCGGEHLVTELG